MISLRDAAEIHGYHAHVYFDDPTRERALALREAIASRFAVEVEELHDRPVGPHPQPMFEVDFGASELPAILPWLMLNRSGLNVLVHPNTGDLLADHTKNPIWLGTPLQLDVEFIRRYLESRAQ